MADLSMTLIEELERARKTAASHGKYSYWISRALTVLGIVASVGAGLAANFKGLTVPIDVIAIIAAIPALTIDGF